MADNLASALLAKIEQLERRAEAAKPGPWKPDYHAASMHNITAADGHSLITGGLMGSPDIAHVLAHDPREVLRLCRAHRDLIERVSSIWHQVVEGDCWFTCAAATEEREGDTTCREDAGTDCDCGRDQLVAALLGDLARGLGVEETSDGN